LSSFSSDADEFENEEDEKVVEFLQGHEFDMVDDKKIQEYECPICNGLIRETVELPCCHKLICNGCRMKTKRSRGNNR